MNGLEMKCHQKNIRYKSNIVYTAYVPPADHNARSKLVCIATQFVYAFCVKAGWRSGLVRASHSAKRRESCS